MQFPTIEFFAFFLVVFIIAIYLKKYPRAYKYYILLISLFFYAFFGKNYIFWLVGDIIVNYLFLLLVNGSTKYRKLFLIAAIIVNVLFLGVFKYYNFFINSALQAFNSLGIQQSIGVLQIIAPIGISFFTFRVISHIVDIYKGKITLPQFIDYACYISFFPQITAGPIARPDEFYTNLNNPTLLSYSSGRVATLILSGLAKKLVVASFLFNYTSGPFSAPLNYSSLDLFFSMLAYGAMIYMDFSGYTDLSAAVANLLGFYTPKNFDHPYKAIGLKDFWARWHITLSNWLKDYIYIPLGGNRKGRFRKYLNLFATMFISGLWHGAGLQFIVWGVLHGIGTILTHLFDDYIVTWYFNLSRKLRLKIESFLPFIQAIGWLITYLYINFCWIFFNSSNIENAKTFIYGIFDSSITQIKILDIRLVIIIIFVLLINFKGEYLREKFIKTLNSLPFIAKIVIVSILIYIIISLGPETMPPFIYFNF